MTIDQKLRQLREELTSHLHEGIAAFWYPRAVDADHGGYLTAFDGDGKSLPDTDKYLVAQARMLWAFSAFYRLTGDARYAAAANHGAAFLSTHLWDHEYGGWLWRTTRDGQTVDEDKFVYGQSFALYAYAEHALATDDAASRQMAVQTFDLLQIRACDVRFGGYLEGFTRDWRMFNGPGAGRKSLDVHMHLMEAYTSLAQLTADPVHRRRLAELADLIATRMVDPTTGACGCEYDRAWNAVPTMPDTSASNAADAAALPTLLHVTAYGHNIELVWLLALADRTLGRGDDHRRDLLCAIGEHTLRHGVDARYGGVFSAGPPAGPATDRDKEWWQQAESLVGFADLYRLTRDDRYAKALLESWRFARQHLIDDLLGEWHTKAREDGSLMDENLGGPWKAAYHTSRAAMETVRRLDAILS